MHYIIAHCLLNNSVYSATRRDHQNRMAKAREIEMLEYITKR